MHNGNPKLTCNDETCKSCEKIFKDVVQPLPRYSYVCDTCATKLLQESHLAQKEEVSRRDAQLQANRDYIAKHLGWTQTEDKQWKNDKTSQLQSQHPVAADFETAKKLLPSGWTVKQDDIYLAAFDSGSLYNKENISDLYKQEMIMVPTTEYFTLITNETVENAKMHDYFNLIVKILEHGNEKE